MSYARLVPVTILVSFAIAYFINIAFFGKTSLFAQIKENSKNQEMKMEEVKNTITKLEAIKEYIKKIGLDKWNRDKLMNVLEWELELERRDLFMNLGKKVYQEELTETARIRALKEKNNGT